MKTALYRKYRPTTFDGVIGQDVIVTTLTNQIRKGAVSHAYLFTGSRGTGKTSCAKIFARAINCASPINGSPCGKCDTCKALTSPTNLDVLEMDAASNNGVDYIRELRENVSYLPTSGKYKVYIIDEVHMLSSSAFNALLKTLEEPPAHVVFILCTTEAHKLPATILSRCMRFDFNLVPTEELYKLIKKIFDAEGAKAEDQALWHIAKLGEGSVRDTLSVGDRCMAASDNLTYELALKVTGAGGTAETASLLDAVVRADAGEIIRLVEQLASAGRSVSQISHELTVFARDLMMLIASGVNPTASVEIVEKAKDLASRTNLNFLVQFVRVLGGADAEIRYSTSPRIVLESALLSLCLAPAETVQSVATPAVNTTPAVKFNSSPSSSVQSNEKSIENKERITPPLTRDGNAVAVLGLIRNKLRHNSAGLIIGEYGNLPDENVRLVGNKFVIFVEGGSYLTFTEPNNMREVQNILDEQGKGYVLTVERLTSGASVMSQILDALQGLEVEVVDGKGKTIRTQN